jgi:hypothetical protein
MARLVTKVSVNDCGYAGVAEKVMDTLCACLPEEGLRLGAISDRSGLTDADVRGYLSRCEGLVNRVDPIGDIVKFSLFGRLPETEQNAVRVGTSVWRLGYQRTVSTYGLGEK